MTRNPVGGSSLAWFGGRSPNRKAPANAAASTTPTKPSQLPRPGPYEQLRSRSAKPRLPPKTGSIAAPAGFLSLSLGEDDAAGGAGATSILAAGAAVFHLSVAGFKQPTRGARRQVFRGAIFDRFCFEFVDERSRCARLLGS